MDVTRQSHRYHVDKRREFSLCTIPFKSLVCAVAVAHVVDLSRYGLGIESDQQLEPGFVWFKDRIGGFKGGLLVWAKKVGTKYRAGIKFVPLSRDKELLVQGRIDAIRPFQPLNNPEVIISTILESMTRDQTGEQKTPDQAAPEDLKALRSGEKMPTEEDLIAQLRAMLTSL
jgi:hypothetical protein